MTDEIRERQRRSFEHTAQDYDRYRPSYPKALFDDVRAYADLAPEDQVIDVGCGPGRGTIFFAGWGNPVLAIEPAPAMAAVARRNLAPFANVEVRTARFEDADLDPAAAGLAACVQAWHWLDPDTRVRRFADALCARGTAGIIANVQATPEHNLPFWARVQDVYREHAPEMMHRGKFREPHELPDHPLHGCDLFYDFEQIGHPWHWTLDTADYLGLCATHSNMAALEGKIRERLLAGIGDLIDAEFDGHVTEHYVALAGLARRA